MDSNLVQDLFQMVVVLALLDTIVLVVLRQSEMLLHVLQDIIVHQKQNLALNIHAQKAHIMNSLVLFRLQIVHNVLVVVLVEEE